MCRLTPSFPPTNPKSWCGASRASSSKYAAPSRTSSGVGQREHRMHVRGSPLLRLPSSKEERQTTPVSPLHRVPRRVVEALPAPRDIGWPLGECIRVDTACELSAMPMRAEVGTVAFVVGKPLRPGRVTAENITGQPTCFRFANRTTRQSFAHTSPQIEHVRFLHEWPW
jgi:hypothetical protein